MACRYTYKGKVYSEEEFKALLASGELAKAAQSGRVKLEIPSSQFERMMGKAQNKAANQGYDIGIAEGKIVGEIEGMVRGLKEGAKRQKKEQRALNEQVADAIRENKIISKLPYSKMQKLLTEAGKVDSPVKLNSFIKKANEIVYGEAFSQIEKERKSKAKKKAKSFRKAARSKDAFANDKAVLRDLGRVNVAALQKAKPQLFEKFEKLSERVAAGLGNPLFNKEGFKDKQRGATNSEIASFLEEYNKWYESFQKKKLIKKYPELDLNKDMSIEDMMDVIAEGNVKEGIPQEELEAKREVALMEARGKLFERLEKLDTTFEGVELNSIEKEALKALKNLEVSLLSPKQLLKFNRIMENVTINQTLDGAGEMIVESRVQKDISNMIEVLQKQYGAEKIKGFFDINDGDFTNLVNKAIAGYMPLAQVLKRMTLNSKLASQLRLTYGIQEASAGYAALQNDIDNLEGRFKKEYKRILKDNESIETYHSTARRGMAALVIQSEEGETLRESQDSFERMKKRIKDSIDKKLKSGKREYIDQASVELKAYDELFEGAANGNEVFERLNSDEQSMVEFWIKEFEGIKEAFDTTNRIYSNKALPMPKNYTPITFSVDETAPIKKDDSDPFANQFLKDFISTEGAGSANERKKTAGIPNGRFMSFDMDSNNFNKYREAMYQVRTLPARMRAKAATSDPRINETVGTADNKILHHLLSDMFKAQTGFPDGDSWVVDALLNLSNKLSRPAARLALASPVQFVKQMANVYIGAAVRNPDVIKYAATSPKTSHDNNLFKYSNIKARINTSAGTKVDLQKPDIKEASRQFAPLIRKTYDKVTSHISHAQEGMTDRFLRPLTKGDATIAQHIWKGYYRQYLENKGEWTNWDNEVENPSEAASAYADQRIEETQGANARDTMSQILKSGNATNKLFKAILFPFQTFAQTQRARLMNDIRALRKAGNGVEKDKALADLAATVAEVSTYRAMQLGIGYMIILGAQEVLKSVGYSDDEAEELAKQKTGAEWLKQIGLSNLKELLLSGYGTPVETAGQKFINDIGKALGSEKNLYYISEDPLQWIGMPGVTIGESLQLTKDLTTIRTGKSEIDKVVFGGTEPEEFELDDKQNILSYIVGGIQFVNTVGFSVQELNQLNDKIRRAIVSSEKLENKKAKEYKKQAKKQSAVGRGGNRGGGRNRTQRF